MARKTLDPKLAQEALDLVALHGSNAKAAAAIGIAPSTIHQRAATGRQLKLKPNPAAIANGTDGVLTLKSRVKRLEAELKASQQAETQTGIIKSVIGALSNKVNELDPPQWLITPNTRPSAPGVPTLFLSDLHWGEVVYPSQVNNVNEYNLKIARKRMTTLVDSAIHLLEIISPKMNYPGIVVPLGGDMISGDIHEELTATNELPSLPTLLDLYEVMVGVITSLADKFGAVFLPTCTGNHGRNTKKIWAKDRHATSFDWLLYQFLAKHFAADKRITFLTPDGPATHFKIYGHRYRLSHGDRLGRGGDGIIGALGPIIRGDHRTRARDAQIDLAYDTQIIGHFHQLTMMTRVIVNGCLKGMDEYSYTEGYPFEPPQQALWLTHPRYGITYRMPVFVDRERPAFKTEWVSIPK